MSASCPFRVRFGCGSCPVRVCVRVLVSVGVRDRVLVRVRVRLLDVVSVWVRVGFVSGSCLGSCLDG